MPKQDRRSSSTATIRSRRSRGGFYDKPFFLYLGRHIGLPVALEGALKLKEISLHPDRGLLGGRDEARADRAARREDAGRRRGDRIDHVYDKIVSNIQEVRARGAHVIAIATDGNEDIQHHANDVIYVPERTGVPAAVLAVVPLQLLAYRIARLRGSTSTSLATWRRRSRSSRGSRRPSTD